MPFTLFLVEEAENVAVFPDESGQFRPSQLTVGVTYEVHGDGVDKHTKGPSNPSQPSSPYGAYTSPVYTPSKQPFMPPTSKTKSLRRSISLVSLSGVDHTKSCSSKGGKFEYTIVTQLYVCLAPDQCNVSCVADLVAKQVGFSVVFSTVSAIHSHLLLLPLGMIFGRVQRKFWQRLKLFMHN